MSAIEHLILIRAHVKDTMEEFSDVPPRRNAEVMVMLWGILDRVTQIENEIGDYHGRSKELET